MSSSDPPAEPSANPPEVPPVEPAAQDPPVEPRKKGFNKKILVIIPIAVAALVGLFVAIDIAEHQAFETVVFEMCDFGFDNSSIGLDGDILLGVFDSRMTMCGYNPNPIDAKLDRIEVDVYTGNYKIAEMIFPDNIIVPKNGEVDVDIMFKTNGLFMNPFYRGADLRIVGTEYYDSLFGTIETSFSADFDLPDEYDALARPDFPFDHFGSMDLEPWVAPEP